MRLRTFIFGYVLVLAVYLFAKHRAVSPQPSSSFRRIVDLTQDSTNSNDLPATVLDAPAHSAPGLWTADQIPADRLTAPLVVLEVRDRAQKNPGYEVSVEDVADWEQAHGEIPPNAVVIAHTGWNPNETRRFPTYSMDAAQFLVEGREAIALGIDTPSVESSSARNFGIRAYTHAHSVYDLENVANLTEVPTGASIVVVDPAKLKHAKTAPVKLLAMVQ